MRKARQRRYVSILTGSRPGRIMEYGKDLVVPAFKNAYREIPAYKSIYAGVSPASIRTVSDFQEKVPAISKKDIFPIYRVSELCRKGTLDDMELMMASSGYSSTFAYGAFGKSNDDSLKADVGALFDLMYDTEKVKTFLINTLAMGVKVATPLQHANTSVRTDMAAALVKKLKPEFGQFIIIGDPFFIKCLIEYGIDNGVDWKAVNARFICGQDFMPETLRSYLLSLIGQDDPNKLVIAQTMGATELDLNIFHESPELVRIRQECLKNKELKSALFGAGIKYVPSLFHYYPHRTFIEIEDGERIGSLLFSMLSARLIMPLFRYSTGDVGKLFAYEDLAKIMDDFNLSHLQPRLKLPLCAIYGRDSKHLKKGKNTACPAQFKEALFADHDIASKITGMFFMHEPFSVDIQLKEGIKKSQKIQKRLQQIISNHLGFSMDIRVFGYNSFPHQMTVDYEQKFHTL